MDGIVDTHAHIYSDDVARYPLMAEPYLPPPGKGTLPHLRHEMEANGVRRMVLVHTFTAYRWDNRLLADTVRECREWATGVCALNPDDPDSPALLERYLRDYGVRGLRVFPVATAEGGRDFERPGHLRLWEKCAELGMVVCALIHPPLIPTLIRFVRRFPDLPVVLDHCANLDAKDAPDSEAVRQVLSLAEYPNVYAKLSFLVTGSHEEYPFRDTHRFAHQILGAFGAERCMWGSDFPCELWIPKASYAQHLRLFSAELGLDDAALDAGLGGTALRLWFPREAVV